MAGSKSNISEEEREKRQKAVDYARASSRLSGLECDEAFEESAERFIRGEIGLAEFANGD